MYFGIASKRLFQSVPATYVTENKETYFEIYTYQESCPLVLSLLNISSLYLHDSYNTKFDFMNCAFAKLVVACLYDDHSGLV